SHNIGAIGHEKNRVSIMSKLKSVRKGLALAAVLPLAVFGLAACVAEADLSDREDRERAPKATQPGGSTEGGNLPFPFPGGDGGGDTGGNSGGTDTGGTDTGGTDTGGNSG